MLTEVTNLGTGEQHTYTLTPHEAVRAAWLYERGKTIDLATFKDRTPLMTAGDKTIACGDWCAMKGVG